MAIASAYPLHVPNPSINTPYAVFDLYVVSSLFSYFDSFLISQKGVYKEYERKLMEKGFLNEKNSFFFIFFPVKIHISFDRPSFFVHNISI